MKLVPNWRRVALRAYSMWFGGYLPLLWLLVPEVLFAVWGIEISPVLVWVIAFLLATLGPLSRVIDQGFSR